MDVIISVELNNERGVATFYEVGGWHHGIFLKRLARPDEEGNEWLTEERPEVGDYKQTYDRTFLKAAATFLKAAAAQAERYVEDDDDEDEDGPLFSPH